MNSLARTLTVFLVLLLSSAPAGADTDDSAELTAMLNTFLAGASIDDAAAHDRFWAEDLIYTTSGGLRISKADIMGEMSAPPADSTAEPLTAYTAEDIRIQQYGDTAIVAFRLVGTTPTADAGAAPVVLNYFNTGTFLRREGEWRVVAWQATRIPPGQQSGQ